jgi:nucleoside-diphosphate-sugar epimerase
MSLRILVLGGTVFLGRRVHRRGALRGHRVTHFHRAKSFPPDPRVETIVGDRTATPFRPRFSRATGMPSSILGLLAAGRGAFGSVATRTHATLSLRILDLRLSRPLGASIDEASPVEPPPDPLPETFVPELYGA